MSMVDRGAQFAPFAALTGYNDQVKETARTTDRRIELDDSQKLIINEKLIIAMEKSSAEREIAITYFEPDSRKDGGAYTTINGVVKRIYEYEGFVLLKSGDRIPIKEIINIEFI